MGKKRTKYGFEVSISKGLLCKDGGNKLELDVSKSKEKNPFAFIIGNFVVKDDAEYVGFKDNQLKAKNENI